METTRHWEDLNEARIFLYCLFWWRIKNFSTEKDLDESHLFYLNTVADGIYFSISTEREWASPIWNSLRYSWCVKRAKANSLSSFALKVCFSHVYYYFLFFLARFLQTQKYWSLSCGRGLDHAGEFMWERQQTRAPLEVSIIALFGKTIFWTTRLLNPKLVGMPFFCFLPKWVLCVYLGHGFVHRIALSFLRKVSFGVR